AADVGLDCGDPARDDRHVADGVEPDRRIDHTPAFDDKIIRRCRHMTNVSERRGRCAEELAPIHHGPPFPNTGDGCNLYHKARAYRWRCDLAAGGARVTPIGHERSRTSWSACNPTSS